MSICEHNERMSIYLVFFFFWNSVSVAYIFRLCKYDGTMVSMEKRNACLNLRRVGIRMGVPVRVYEDIMTNYFVQASKVPCTLNSTCAKVAWHDGTQNDSIGW